MTHDEIFAKVRDVLVEALGADEEEVTPTATLRGNLGAESIDFLDINFQLEKAFDFKSGQGELVPESLLKDPRYVVDGKVTPEGLKQLKERMPGSDFSKFDLDPQVRNVTETVTVETLVKFVEQKLAKQPA